MFWAPKWWWKVNTWDLLFQGKSRFGEYCNLANMAIFSRMEQLLTLQKPNMDAAKIYQWSWALESVVISTAGYKAWLKVLCRGIIHFPHLRLIKFSANDPIWGQSAIWETWMVFLIWESWIPEEKKIISCKVPNTSKHLAMELGRKNPISNSNNHVGENTAYLLVFGETSKSRLDISTFRKVTR